MRARVRRRSLTPPNGKLTFARALVRVLMLGTDDVYRNVFNVAVQMRLIDLWILYENSLPRLRKTLDDKKYTGLCASRENLEGDEANCTVKVILEFNFFENK